MAGGAGLPARRPRHPRRRPRGRRGADLAARGRGDRRAAGAADQAELGPVGPGRRRLRADRRDAAAAGPARGARLAPGAAAPGAARLVADPAPGRRGGRRDAAAHAGGASTTVSGWYRQMRERARPAHRRRPRRSGWCSPPSGWSSPRRGGPGPRSALYGYRRRRGRRQPGLPRGRSRGDAWRAVVERGAASRPGRGRGVLRRAPDRPACPTSLASRSAPTRSTPWPACRRRRGVDGTTRSGVLVPVGATGCGCAAPARATCSSLPLPLVHAREVDLKRRDGELLVSVGDHRRVLTLPAALQRCVVRGARVREGTLRVTLRAGPRPVAGPGGPTGRERSRSG